MDSEIRNIANNLSEGVLVETFEYYHDLIGQPYEASVRKAIEEIELLRKRYPIETRRLQHCVRCWFRNEKELAIFLLTLK